MSSSEDDLKPEYADALIRSGVRGKYSKQYREGANVVVIDPDLSRVFPNAKSVNDALRRYLVEHPKTAS